MFTLENPPSGSEWRYLVRYGMKTPKGWDIDMICALDWSDLQPNVKEVILKELNK